MRRVYIGVMEESNKNEFLKKYRTVIVWVLFSLGLLSLLFLTRPSDTHFGLSLLALVLLWGSLYFFCATLLKFSPLRPRGVMIKNISISVASMAVLVAMFSALGGVSVFDIVLLFFLTVLGAFYFARTWPK